MAIYGIRDTINMILVNKRTKQIDLFVNYANATSSEWSSESVYATKKGANAIRWDQDRTGTLTIDTEVFDFGFLAMVMGSQIAEGRSDIMKRAEAVLDRTMEVVIGEGSTIDPETVTVIKLNDSGSTEHAGKPLFNASAAKENLPAQVKNVSISANDTTARITFGRVNGADKYLIFRDNSQIAEVNTTSYTDTGLTAETQYTYKVRAVNEFGKGAESAVVKPTTATTGTSEFTTYTATSQDKNAAASNQGEVVAPDSGEVSYVFNSGTIKFTNAAIGDVYAIYFLEQTENVRTLTIEADKFADNYEIYGTSKLRNEDGVDQMVEVHFMNAKPQSNFTLTQSATEPTSLSVVFDLFPVRKLVDGETKNILMEYKVIQ